MVKNKKAIVRIIEAATAIVLIATVLVVIYSQQTRPVDTSDQISELQRGIILEIRDNNTLRSAVLDSNEILINEFVSNSIPKSLNFEIRICNLSSPCQGITSIGVKNSVYVEETPIINNLTTSNPKRLRFFIWEK